MHLSREDMLRELELLPVWQLRARLPQALSQPVTQVEIAPPQTETPQMTVLPEPQCRLIVSDDANYCFVLSPTQSQEEETLLQNMLKSIACKPRMDSASQGIDTIATYSPKVIIAMGEMATLRLLGQTDALQALSEKQHSFNNIPVIVTYHPSHLLVNVADKSKAWADLCVAKSVTQGL